MLELTVGPLICPLVSSVCPLPILSDPAYILLSNFSGVELCGSNSSTLKFSMAPYSPYYLDFQSQIPYETSELLWSRPDPALIQSPTLLLLPHT